MIEELKHRCTKCNTHCTGRLSALNKQIVCSLECADKINEDTIPGYADRLNSIKPAEISDTLAERGKDYGKFADQARITQALKAVMKDTPNWDKLDPDMKEALDMTVHKIARILNGNPYKVDSWFDIEGYTKLVRVRIETGEKYEIR